MTRPRLSLPSPAKGLSARLLVLTIFFVMLAEVLIFVPSMARYRLTYLEEKLASAHLAVLTLEATPDQMVSEELQGELLGYVGAHSIALRRPGEGKLMLMRESPGQVDASFDLRSAGAATLVADAFASLIGPGDRVIRVVGRSPHQPAASVEVVIDEAPLCQAMFAFGERILALSLVISLMTAALVYVALHLLLVRPMRRVTASMTRFREDPEDLTAQIRPSNRTDEIGVAERELASMQARLAASLHQKTRLAALGIAVTKVNHDLKNILSSARLVSDRLADSDDPDVRRIAPTLVRTIDRAVHLCQQTLNFTQEGPPQLELSRFDLSELVADVATEIAPAESVGERTGTGGRGTGGQGTGGQGTGGQGPGDQITGGRAPAGPVLNRLPAGLEVEADRDQLYRVFANLLRNAVEAGATAVTVTADSADRFRSGRAFEYGLWSWQSETSSASRLVTHFGSSASKGSQAGRKRGVGSGFRQPARQVAATASAAPTPRGPRRITAPPSRSARRRPRCRSARSRAGNRRTRRS